MQIGNKDIYESYCYGKDIVPAMGELCQSVKGLVVDGRKYKITVELLPDVTVDACLRAAVESGKLVQDSPTRYRWVDASLSFKSLWVHEVVKLTGLTNQWKWAEELFGEKNLKQELYKAKKIPSVVFSVRKILPH